MVRIFALSCLMAFVSNLGAVVRFPTYSVDQLLDSGFVKQEIEKHRATLERLQKDLQAASPLTRATLGEDIRRTECVLEALNYIDAKGFSVNDRQLLKLAFFRRAVVEGLPRTALPERQSRSGARLSFSAGHPDTATATKTTGDSADKSEAITAASAGQGGAEISFGEAVNLRDHLVAGQITVFEFYSKYCGPCRQIAPMLASLDERRDDVTVIRVNINRPDVEGIDWESPVVSQYGIRSVPHFIIYGPPGDLEAEGDEAYSLISLITRQAGVE